MTEPKKYRKRPVTIEAMRLPERDPEGVDPSSDGYARNLQAARVYGWVAEHIGTVSPPCDDEPGNGADSGVTIDPADGCLVIRTLEGDMKAELGDWIIRGVQGEFYPIKESIFMETYEEVSDDGQ